MCGGAPEREADDHGARELRAGPVLAEEARPSRAQGHPEGHGDEDRVVELTGDGDEIGHHVEGQRELFDQREYERLA